MRDIWVTVAFLERYHGLSRSHVYKLASVHQWRKRKHGRVVEYAALDVHDTLGCLRSRNRPSKV